MPDGIKCSFHVSPLRTIVCPALLPPWKRTTASARSASRSVTFPLPSSPHWAPTITIPGTAGSVYVGQDDHSSRRGELGGQRAEHRPRQPGGVHAERRSMRRSCPSSGSSSHISVSRETVRAVICSHTSSERKR